MQYDITLKEIIPLARTLLACLLGEADLAGLRLLHLEFSSTLRRTPDFVFQTAAGGIVHIELQSSNLARMMVRVAGYSLLLEEKFPDARIEHIVLYTGLAPLSMPDTFVSKSGKHRFEARMVDIREFDGTRLMISDCLQDNLVAVLCGGVDHREAIRAAMRKLRDYPDKQRGDYLAQQLVLSGMRRIEPMVLEESKSIMPITLDLMENSVIRGFVEEAERKAELRATLKATLETKSSAVRAVLEELFSPVPEFVVQRLTSASGEDLDRWLRRAVRAKSLEQVFD